MFNEKFFELLKTSCPILWRQEHYQQCDVSYSGSGWEKMILELSKNIEKEINTAIGLLPIEGLPQILYIKEKFGAMRFVVTSIPEPIFQPINKLIIQAETASLSICEFCGAGGELRHNWPGLPDVRFGWVRVLCEPCWYEEAEIRAMHQTNPQIRRWLQTRMKLKKSKLNSLSKENTK